MKLTASILTAILAIGFNAAAAPCFHAGTYEGKGFGWDSSGKVYPYEVETLVADENTVSSNYKWNAASSAVFSFKVDQGKLLIDGKLDGGSIECGMSTEVLTVQNAALTLNEEWTFTGNYLLRHGHKVTSGGVVDYQELLIRK